MDREKRLRRQIPPGVQDTLPNECYSKRAIENACRDCFIKSGYDEVETPGFEYYDVFCGERHSLSQERLLKLVDSNGHILALRPEWTIPIARMAATKTEHFPARFCYVGNAYDAQHAYYGSQKEFTQAGIELLGVTGPHGDAEVVALSIEALRAADLQGFSIELGQVEFFKGLMEEAGLDRSQSETLRGYVDQKNDLAVALFLQECHLSQDVQNTILQLSTLYGGEEVFDRAQQFSSHPRCRAAVDNLREIHRLLCEFGLGELIMIDFGMLQSIDYYSGLIFKGYSEDIGFPILSGGRYDALLSDFGVNVPATGCAIGIKRIMIALERADVLREKPGIDAVVSGAPAASYAHMQALRSQGLRVAAALDLNEQELQAYAQSIGAKAVFVKKCQEVSEDA